MLAVGMLVAATAAEAQLGAEIARQHAARAGGNWRKIRTLYTEGQTRIGQETVSFRTWSARPDRLRVESFGGLRRVIQCFDGIHEPWISHTEVDGGKARLMTESDVTDFIANADFDGPLVDYAAKGFTVDYAGEDEIDGRPAFKLLLMNARDEVFFYCVDKQNYEIVKRTVFRVAKGERVAVETFFRDFKPVGGALQPHRVETRLNGRVIYLMIIDKFEANPPATRFPPDIFAAPKDWPEYRKDQPKTAGGS